VPIDFGGMHSTGTMATAYSRPVSKLGLQEDVLVHVVVQKLAQPSDAVLDRSNLGVVDLDRAFLTAPGD
jgi:hypothetical protein